MQNLRLTLLVIFVFCAGLISPVDSSEVQSQRVEFESEYVLPNATEDDEPIASVVEPFAKEFLFLSVSCGELLPVVGSDAYPSSTLHGPPGPNGHV